MLTKNQVYDSNGEIFYYITDNQRTTIFIFSSICTLLWQEVFALAGGRTMTKCHNGESFVYGLDMLDIQAMLEEYA